jgi:hypothetical protein
MPFQECDIMRGTVDDDSIYLNADCLHALETVFFLRDTLIPSHKHFLNASSLQIASAKPRRLFVHTQKPPMRHDDDVCISNPTAQPGRMPTILIAL